MIIDLSFIVPDLKFKVQMIGLRKTLVVDRKQKILISQQIKGHTFRTEKVKKG
jgi:hypothetical protein